MEDGLEELIRLADPPGTSGHVVSLRILELPATGQNFLDCEFVVETETVTGSFGVAITPDDLDDWEEALDTLVGNRFVSWLNSGRSVRFKIKPLRPGVIEVSIHDGPSSQVTVTVPLAPASGWIDEHRARLARARQMFVG